MPPFILHKLRGQCHLYDWPGHKQKEMTHEVNKVQTQPDGGEG